MVRDFVKALKYLSFAGMALIAACGGGGTDNSYNIDPGVFGPNVSGTPDSFRGAGIVNDEQFLIGGPLAQGRNGDILLQNDKIRVILQKPTRNTGVGLFGGNILDADRFRPKAEPGQDQFGTIFPLVNLSWTVNYQRLEIINADFGAGPVVVRATGVLDVYDYIQTNIIVPFAQIFAGATLLFDTRFDDIYNPFTNVPELRGLNPVIVTEYSLKSDASYVIMETRFQNDGEVPVKMPVGDWVNGSGTLEPFVPLKGFVKTPQIEPAASLIYQGMEDNVGVSYGYFYNPVQFLNEDGTIRPTTALTVSGVTPMVLGESLLKVLPISANDFKVNFEIQPGTRTITRYFAVGTGDVASVLDSGFSALGVAKLRMSGKVVDANGQPVARARVVAIDSGSADPAGHLPANVAMSAADGTFSADLSSGNDVKDKIFGSGTYSLQVYKEGYVFAGGPKAGKCSGGTVDTAAKTISGVECTLGQTGTVSVTASENGSPIPARITIVGFEPSPIHVIPMPNSVNGVYGDINLEERPYGIVDLLYVDPNGNLAPVGHHRIVGTNKFRLEPGEYEIYVTRGTEYSVYRQRVTVPSGGNVDVDAELKKVVDTAGYVAADFHMHGIKSADSIWSLESRVHAGLAEGMDILVASDHDYITDYAPVIEKLGYSSLMTSICGDEVTALAFGHLGTFPLTQDTSSTTGGAYDYTYIPENDDMPNFNHDMGQTMDQIITGIDESQPGTQVFTINHILDKATGNFAIAGLVTSTLFDGVAPMSSYADPVNYRMPANTNEGGGFQGPFPFGTSGLVATKFTALELTIGAYADTLDHLMQTALPAYFNMLNLGFLAAATTNSDSHTQVREPMGTPRNYVVSSTDPRDGVGSSFQAIDKEEIAVNVNERRSIASNGIFMTAKLSSASNPGGVGVGGTITGTGEVTLELDIRSNDFFDWDRVDIFANTLPIPAKDDLSGVTDLSAADFHKTSHTQKYLMTPLFQFSRGGSGDAALNQTVAGGVRKVSLSRSFNFSEDTWIVVVVRGSNGVRSLFPYVTRGANTTVPQASFLDTLDSNPAAIGGIRPFAFTNPIFVDVDGNGFQSKFVRDGQSPLAQ